MLNINEYLSNSILKYWKRTVCFDKNWIMNKYTCQLKHSYIIEFMTLKKNNNDYFMVIKIDFSFWSIIESKNEKNFTKGFIYATLCTKNLFNKILNRRYNRYGHIATRCLVCKVAVATLWNNICTWGPTPFICYLNQGFIKTISMLINLR